jgi:caa(3)-type oxidase subunit IV
MSERLLSPLAFIIIDVVLIALTILTVGLSFLPATPSMHAVFGMGIGLVKASLVILFFMHALESTKQTWAVISVSVFWLIVVLGALTYSDYLTRGMLPYLPGH